MINLIISQIWPYLLGAAALVTAWFAARAGGKAAARQEMDAAINKQASQARKEARDVENTVAKMGDDLVADKLKSRWVRDSKGRD